MADKPFFTLCEVVNTFSRIAAPSFLLKELLRKAVDDPIIRIRISGLHLLDSGRC
jgi:hypothetical protein